MTADYISAGHSTHVVVIGISQSRLHKGCVKPVCVVEVKNGRISYRRSDGS